MSREWTARHLGIPALLRRDFEPLRGGEDRKAFAWSGDPPALLITGKRGAGKSQLAAEMLLRWMAAREADGESVHDIGTRFVRASSTLEWDRPTIGRAKRVGYLVIDDLGHGHGAEWEWERVADIGVSRWDAALPTVYTTGLDLEQIARRDASLFDRLAAAAEINLPGGSRR